MNSRCHIIFLLDFPTFISDKHFNELFSKSPDIPRIQNIGLKMRTHRQRVWHLNLWFIKYESSEREVDHAALDAEVIAQRVLRRIWFNRW